MLLKQKYKHDKYQTFTVYDPKKRTILAANLTDRALHHAVYDVLTPCIDTKFIYHSYACRINKGQHKAIDQAQKWCRNSKFLYTLMSKNSFPVSIVKCYFPSLKEASAIKELCNFWMKLFILPPNIIFSTQTNS